MREDLIQAVRGVVRAPGLSATVVGLLAVGVGLVTTMFAFVDAALLEPLPYPEPDRLVRVDETGVGTYQAPLSSDAWSLLQDVDELDAAAYRSERVVVDGPAGPEWLQAARVTPDFFTVVGVAPALGRPLSAADVGGPPVALLGYGYWQRRFDGGDVVGRTLDIGGEEATVIGVLPRRVTLPGGAELWRPLDVDRVAGPVHVFGRLSGGVTRERAAAALDGVSARLGVASPDRYEDRELAMASELIDRSRGLGPLPWLGLGVATLILLIAAANIAGLLLVRSTRRKAEMAVRAALGGSRSRLIRQLLMESGLLSLAGAALGVVVSLWGVSLLSIGLATMPGWLVLDIDLATLGFVAAVLTLVVAMIGVGPALEATGVDLTRPLRGAAPGSTGTVRVRRLGNAQVVAQFAMAFVLVLGAGLFLRSLAGMGAPDWGVDADRVVTVAVSLDAARFESESDRDAVRSRLRERAASIAGIEESAVVADASRLRSSADTVNAPFALSVGGEAVSLDHRFRVEAVSPGYFRTLGLDVPRGRPIDESDGESASPVVVLSRTVARQAFPGRDPVGRAVRLTLEGPEVTVAGVAEDQFALYQDRQGTTRRPIPAVYVPASQWIASDEEVLARAPTAAAAPDLVAIVEAAVSDAAGGVVTRRATTLEAERAITVQVTRWFAGVLGVFGLLALALALVGIYGVVAFRTAQRTREIGIRKAMGAGAPDVLRLVMGGGLELAALGALLGLPLALGAGQLLRRFLYDVTGSDPATLALAFVLLAGTAALATWLPARRAAGVQPGEALRHEG